MVESGYYSNEGYIFPMILRIVNNFLLLKIHNTSNREQGKQSKTHDREQSKQSKTHNEIPFWLSFLTKKESIEQTNVVGTDVKHIFDSKALSSTFNFTLTSSSLTSVFAPILHILSLFMKL